VFIGLMVDFAFTAVNRQVFRRYGLSDPAA
jgi:hypothetical protein